MDTALRRAVIVALALGLCAVARGEAVPVLGNAGRFTADTQVKATKAGDAGAPSFTYRGLEVPTVADFVAGENISITTEGRTLCVDTTGVLTTVSVEALPGHPLRTEVDGSKIVISTKGGTHPLETMLVFDGDADNMDYGDYDDILETGINAPQAEVPLRVNLGYNISHLYNNGEFVQTFYKKAPCFLEFFDNAPDAPFAKLACVNQFGSYVVAPGQASQSSYGTNASVSGQVAVADHVVVGGSAYSALPGKGLAFGSTGTVNGINILAKEDVHALVAGYFSRWCVVGRGRQAVGPIGSLVVSTKGTGSDDEGAPLPGSQQMVVYNDENGTYFSHHYAGLEQGSGGSAFHFDDVIKSNGAPVARVIASGQAVIPKFESLVVVMEPSVAEGDTILVNYDMVEGGGGPLWVHGVVEGSDFTINCSNQVSEDTTVNWRIIR